MTLWEWFTAPKYTLLEQELARRVDYLEAELKKERERYKDLVERIAFPPPLSQDIVPQGPFQSIPSNKVQAEAHRLSQLSKQRLQDQIAEMESRAASISKRDEELSKVANAQAQEKGPSEFEERF